MIPKINGFYTSPGTFLLDARRSLQSRLKLYKNQPPLSEVGGAPVLSNVEAHSELARCILKGGSFAAGRLGTVEGDFIRWRIKHPKRPFPSALLMNGKRLAGIFPGTQVAADSFVSTYLDSVKTLDFLGVRNQDFFNGYFEMERTIVQEARPKKLVSISMLAPLGERDSWVDALRGKKVLVIHPFTTTILSQYNTNRADIFPIRNWLPDFQLQVFRPFQTAGDENPSVEPTTWGHALEIMLDQISSISFDVALVSAGAYGLPLASGIKQLGRGAIHVGGTLQLFFGIRGGRWDAVYTRQEHLARYASESWVRPSKEETPDWHKSVEGGAYW